MDGGVILGQGEYGCVMSNPLPCKYPHYIPGANSHNIMKIGRPNTLVNEYEVSRIIQQIPFSSNYFILLKGSPCELSRKSLEVDPSIKSCEIIAKKGFDHVKGVRMKFGGVSLGDYKFNASKFDIYKFGMHLLEAATMLVTHGIVHWDLHTGNVVVDNYGVPRVIDFGLAIVKKYVNDIGIIDGLKYQYDPWYVQHPPELALFNGAIEKRSIGFMLKDIFDGPRKKKTFNIAQMVLGVTREEQEASIEAFTNESDAFKKADLIEYWNHYWTKLDSWSIGNMILYILYILLKIGYNDNPIYKEHKAMIHSVLKGLLELDPRKRLDVVDALEKWNPNSKIFKKFGISWQKAKG
jgi:hypothetical protein